MTEITLALRRRDFDLALAARILIRLAIVGLLAVCVAGLLYRYPPPLGLSIAGGIGMLGLLLLAVTAYEATVVLGILLSCVVLVEPAPTDAVFSVVIVVATVTGRFTLRRTPMFATASVAVLVLLGLLSTIEAVDLAIAIKYLAITTYLGVFALWLCGYLDSHRRVKWVAAAYIAAAVFTAALGALAAFSGIGIFAQFAVVDRAQGLFKDANVYGPFLIPAVLILIDELLNARLFKLRALTKVVFIAVLVIGIFASFSRAAWLNLAVAVVVMLIATTMRRGGGRRAFIVLAVALIGVAGVGGVVAASGSVEFLEERAQFQSYDSERFGAQNAGLEYGESRPIGVGPGQFELVSPVASHSLYIRLLAEQGFVGLLAMLVLIVGTLVLALRNLARGHDTFGIGTAALLGAWCGLMLNSFVVDTLHWRSFWFVAALIWAGSAVRPNTSPDE